jgi:inorganic phosphate transporter, PiT family
MVHVTTLFWMACIFGFFMAWGIGANDVANAMGTSVGSKAISFRQAMLIAAIFESLGALLAGGQVTNTIRSKIIDINQMSMHPQILVFGMIAALLAAGIWLLFASQRGWPVSTTHTIVGSIIGFGLIEIGPHAIYWSQVTSIVLSWILTPVIAGVIAYCIFRSIQKLVLNTAEPLQNAKRYLPIYIFGVSFIVSLVTLTQGLQHLSIHFNFFESALMAAAFALLVMTIGALLLRKITNPEHRKFSDDFQQVERVFAILMLFTACSMAFAHGSNDVANAIGPLAAAVNILEHATISAQAPLPFWILALGAAGIVLGLATYGYKVIATIGTHITELTPSRGFSAELATAATVVLASGTGLPISTTQTLVGAVLGVGMARGISALNLTTIRNIFMSWIITLPSGAVLTICFFYVLRFFFS